MKYTNSILNLIKIRHYCRVAFILSISLFLCDAYPDTKKESSDIVHYDCLHYPVTHRKGMVVTQNKLATQIGVELLKKGGNAVDAAAGVGFALAVTLPRAGNLGGGGFMLVYLDQPKKTLAIDYAMQTPLGVPQNWRPTPKRKYSYQSVAVPGTVAGLWHVHQNFGKLPWEEVIKPALQLAKQGFHLTEDDVYALRYRQSVLRQDPEVARIFFKQTKEAYQIGDLFKQPELALSLQEIKQQGADAFYKGTLSDKIVQSMQTHGGFITKEDLASYQVKVTEPLWFNYRGHRIACMPPPSGGMVLGSIMNLLEHFPMKKLQANSAESIHVLTEVFKLGRYDSHFVGHALGWPMPKILMSKQYAKQRAQTIKKEGILTQEHIISLTHSGQNESSDTTHYSIVDDAGNVVSNTYTLSDSFGAHVAPPGTGILLNNALRLTGYPNNPIRQQSRKLTPMSRITSSMTPVIVFKHSKAWLATGSLGGRYIPGVLAQLLVNLIDHGFNLAEATMQPRIHYKEFPRQTLELEHTISSDTFKLLKKRGYHVQKAKVMGNTQSILIKDGLLYGAADSRRPGSTAMGID